MKIKEKKYSTPFRVVPLFGGLDQYKVVKFFTNPMYSFIRAKWGITQQNREKKFSSHFGGFLTLFRVKNQFLVKFCLIDQFDLIMRTNWRITYENRTTLHVGRHGRVHIDILPLPGLHMKSEMHVDITHSHEWHYPQIIFFFKYNQMENIKQWQVENWFIALRKGFTLVGGKYYWYG